MSPAIARFFLERLAKEHSKVEVLKDRCERT